MRQVFQMAWKDLKILSRDKLGAFFIVGFPILMGVFFGLVMGPSSSGNVSSKMRIAVVDQDQSKMSRAFVASLQDNDSIAVDAIDDLEQARNSVRKGQRTAMLLLEPGFGETAGLFWEQPPTIKVGADPSRTAETAMLQGYVMEAIGQLAATRFQDLNEMSSFVEQSRQDLASNPDVSPGMRLAVSAFLGSIENLASNINNLQDQDQKEGGTTGATGGPEGFQFANIESIDVTRAIDPNSISGQMLKSKSQWDISFPQAMLWGVLGCVAGFSISIARERSQGTMTRLHIAPISQFQVLLGKALACFLAVLLVVAMMPCLGMVLGLSPDSFGLLLLATLSIAICFVGIMMVMSLLGKTEQSVSGSGWAINMIMAMLGGCMIPVMFMPGFLQQLSVISPVRWAIMALEGAIWREYSVSEMLLPCGVLVSVGAIGLTLGTRMLAADRN